MKLNILHNTLRPLKGSFLLILGLFPFLLSCSNRSSESDFFNLEVYQPDYSGGFKILGSENSDNTLIHIYNPWQGAENIHSGLIIVRDSNCDIKDCSFPRIEGKADRIICMSSTHIALLKELDALDKIVGVSGFQYISDPYIQNNGDRIPDIGYEGNIDYEKLISVHPDLVLLFSVNGASSMEPKLRELKIPFIYIGDYVEENPLGKTEWLVPIADIIGKRETGINKFQQITQKYDELKRLVENENLSHPKVMVNAPFTGAWFMPSTESYIARIIKDAGGEYVYKKNTGNSSRAIDVEEALQLVNESDFWINIGAISSLDEFNKTFPLFLSSNCVQKGNLFNNNLKSTPGGGNDCYESGVVNPDLILKDLIQIFHPGLIDGELSYYQKLQ